MLSRERLQWVGPSTAAFLLGLWAPLSLLIVSLRTYRILKNDALSALALPSTLLADIAAISTFGALGVLVFSALGEKTRWRFGAILVAQIITVAWICLELVAHNFYRVTGSTFDVDLLVYAIARSEETWTLINESTPLPVKIAIGAGTFLALCLPWGIRALWARWREEVPARVRKGRWAIAMAIAATVALVWPLFRVGGASDLVRNATLTFLVSNLRGEDAVGDADGIGFDTRKASLVPRPGLKGRNVVFILLESTRASATSLYNPKLEGTTPHLEKLGKTSIVARNAWAVMPHTSKAIVTTMCGIPPHLTLKISEAQGAGIPAKCLPELYREQGYATGFFQSATKNFESRETLVDNMGFEDFYPLERLGSRKGFEKVNYFGVEDDIMLAPSRRWLKKQAKDKPFFMTYLTLTPHHDYLSPKRYGFEEYDEAEEFNRYLNSVHYVDQFVANVIEMFKKQGRYEDTIFVILGDHGEGFNEHGRSQHDNVIYQEGLHIPMLVHDPKLADKPREVEPRTSQLDLAPTVIELSNFDLTGGNFPGESLLTLDRERRIFAHCWYERRCMATIQGDRKYIDHFGTQPAELFDLSKDPLEKKSLFTSEEAVKVEHEALSRWRANVNAFYEAHQDEFAKRYASKEKPESAHALDIQIGDKVKIVGVTVTLANPQPKIKKDAKPYKPGDPIRPGTEVIVETVFESVEKVPSGWSLFMHGEGKKTKLKNHDHVPVEGTHPLQDWEPGTYITDRYKLRIPRRAREEYKLLLGIYHKKEGRMPVKGGEATKDNRATLVKIPLTL